MTFMLYHAAVHFYYWYFISSWNQFLK